MSIVVTVYGKKDGIDKIAVTAFDERNRWADDALTYCRMTNKLKIADDNWVFAKLIPEDKPISLEDLLPSDLFKLMSDFDRRTIQWILSEADKSDIARVLIGCDEPARELFFKNMSSTTRVMVEEAMDSVKSVSKEEMEASKEKIKIKIMQLESQGKI